MSQLLVVPILDHVVAVMAELPGSWGGLGMGDTGGPLSLAWVFVAVTFAYVVFAVAGFGTALVAAPLVAQVLTVAQVVPVLAALDLVAALRSLRQRGGHLAWGELRRLLPAMALGIAIGTYGLIHLPEGLLQGALGLFAAYQGLRGWLLNPSRNGLSARWGALFGFCGGIFGALFGSGGFLYAIYLGRRLESPAVIRATQALLISCSTFCRTLGFTALGLFTLGGLWQLVVALVPAMVLGMILGRRLGERLPAARFRQLVNGLLVLSGGALLVKALWS